MSSKAVSFLVMHLLGCSLDVSWFVGHQQGKSLYSDLSGGVC